MLDYVSTKNAMKTRTLDITFQEYMFALQVVLGEDKLVAFASVYDKEHFDKEINSEDYEDYLNAFRHDAEIAMRSQNFKQVHEYLEDEYKAEVQAAATNLKDYKFTGSDVQQLLANLLHNRSEKLDDASVRDIIQLVKGLYESGGLDSSDAFDKHFITIPNKYNAICSQCGHELYAVQGLDIKCQFCGGFYKWSEDEKKFFPEFIYS